MSDYFENLPIPGVVIASLGDQRYWLFHFPCRKPCRHFVARDDGAPYCAELVSPGGSDECGSPGARYDALETLMLMARHELTMLDLARNQENKAARAKIHCCINDEEDPGSDG